MAESFTRTFPRLQDGAARDRQLLLASAFLRALATGMVGVLLGIYLAKLDFDPATIGVIVGAGLGGAALAVLVATRLGDRMGRRRFLVGLSVLAAAGGIVVAFASGPWIVGVAAFVGMLNGMGRDRGAALVIEHAILPATTSPAARTRAFAWYNILQDAGHALGGLAAGLPSLLRHFGAVDELPSLRLGVVASAAIVLVPVLLYARLSPAVEVPVAERAARLSPATRTVLWKIGALFALDSLGGGFLTTALLSFFFYERFGVGEGMIGVLFFAARVANALSHLAAAWLASRIGLVNTMVFTHIPSSLLLVSVAWAPTFWVAALLFIVREGLVEMDVPTRQSYVMAVVRPEERTIASGVTHLVRVGAWAVAPAFAGLFMQGVSLATPLIAGAAMKIVYDVLLWIAFRNAPTPEERTRHTAAASPVGT
jgi:MFS family permease